MNSLQFSFRPNPKMLNGVPLKFKNSIKSIVLKVFGTSACEKLLETYEKSSLDQVVRVIKMHAEMELISIDPEEKQNWFLYFLGLSLLINFIVFSLGIFINLFYYLHNFEQLFFNIIFFLNLCIVAFYILAIVLKPTNVMNLIKWFQAQKSVYCANEIFRKHNFQSEAKELEKFCWLFITSWITFLTFESVLVVLIIPMTIRLLSGSSNFPSPVYYVIEEKFSDIWWSFPSYALHLFFALVYFIITFNLPLLLFLLTAVFIYHRLEVIMLLFKDLGRQIEGGELNWNLFKIIVELQTDLREYVSDHICIF